MFAIYFITSNHYCSFEKFKNLFLLHFFDRQSRFIFWCSFSIRPVWTLGEPHEYRYFRMKKFHKYKYSKVKELHEYGYFWGEDSHGYGYPIVKKFDGVIKNKHDCQIFGNFG